MSIDEYTISQFEQLITLHLTTAELTRFRQFIGGPIAPYLAATAHTATTQSSMGPMFPFLVDGKNLLNARAVYDTSIALELRLWHWIYFCIYTVFAHFHGLDAGFGEMMVQMDVDELVTIVRTFNLLSETSCPIALDANLHACLAKSLLAVPSTTPFLIYIDRLYSDKYRRDHALARLKDHGVTLRLSGPGYLYRLVHHLQYTIVDVNVPALYDEVVPNRRFPLMYIAAWMDLDEVALDARQSALHRAQALVNDEQLALEALVGQNASILVDHMLYDADLYLHAIAPERLVVEAMMHRMGFLRFDTYPDTLITSCTAFIDGPLRVAFDRLSTAVDDEAVDAALIAAGRLLTRVPYFAHFSTDEARQFHARIVGTPATSMSRTAALRATFEFLVAPVFNAVDPTTQFQAWCRACGQVRDVALPFLDHLVVNTFLTGGNESFDGDARASLLMKRLRSETPSKPAQFAALIDGME